MEEMISLIIPVYLKGNQKYLDLVLDSIENLGYPKDQLEIIIVASGGFVPATNSIKSVKFKIEYFLERKHYAEAINHGVSVASGEYYFLLSDDVILTKNSLSNIVELSKANKDISIIQGISNCDNTRKYQLMMGFMDVTGFAAAIDISYDYEDLKPYAKELMDAKSIYPVGVIFNTFLCFYAVFIPKKVWDVVGTLDEKFENGQEDIDYCIRARKTEAPLLTTLNSVIWHFSGKTANTTVGQEMRDKNQVYFKEKWGKPVEEFLK